MTIFFNSFLLFSGSPETVEHVVKILDSAWGFMHDALPDATFLLYFIFAGDR